MSLVTRLHDVNRQLDESRTLFQTKISNVEDLQFVFHEEGEIASGADLHNMSLYQLNALKADLEQSSAQLNQLWLVNSLRNEIKVLLDSGNDSKVWEQAELESIFENLKKLDQRIGQIRELAIAMPLTSNLNDLIDRFNQLLVESFRAFVPDAANGTFVIYPTMRGESDLSFNDYVTLTKKFEEHFSKQDVTSILKAQKLLWERQLLANLRNLTVMLELTKEATQLRLTITQLQHEAPVELFLDSASAFVLFVSALDNQPIKNFYGGKLSSLLVEKVSNHIAQFADPEGPATQKLSQLVDLFAELSWSVPMRNFFTNQNDVAENIRELRHKHLTDVYISRAREIFSEPFFSNLIANLQEYDESYKIEKPPVQPPMKPSASLTATPRKSPKVEAASDELEWNDDWGSDDDSQDFEPQQNTTNEWDDNWDEDWDDQPEEPQPTSQTTRTRNTLEAPRVTTSSTGVSAATSEVADSDEICYYKVLRSAIPGIIADLLSSFDAETEGADPATLVNAIFALALTSYPSLEELTLLVNDMKAVSNEFLATYSKAEWAYACKNSFNVITDIISKAELVCDDLEDGDTRHLQKAEELHALISMKFETQLQRVNPRMFQLHMTQCLELINHVTLQTILECEEITEYLSERFTQFLESIQSLEIDVLARIGGGVVLPSSSKVQQTKFLINNHLKDIMESFYQGELYEFTTQELIGVIKSTFVASTLREQCIQDIVEIRNI